VDFRKKVGIGFMLITEKRPPGTIYPQLKQVPTSTYADFLNFFRDRHTVDDNLAGPPTQATLQYKMLETAIASGHLAKSKNKVNPDEFLLDIFLTEAGSEFIQTYFDRKFCEMAVAEARKSVAEDDGELHPRVGAVVVKGGEVLATGYRGETGEGRHAEFCALKKINNNVNDVDLSGCTVYSTLEPCSSRKSPKTACATRLINAKVSRVVFGMADKDESVYGHVSLLEADIEVSLFPKSLIQELVSLNKEWSDTRRTTEVAPAANQTAPLANASYYKPGAPVENNLHLYVRPPAEAGGFFTIEDASKTVLAWARTTEDIAFEWRQIDVQKTIREGLKRQTSGTRHHLLAL
jgi:pyrimidine deaminase RibD-like protein